MSYRSYDYTCRECGYETIELIPRDCGEPPVLDCGSCGRENSMEHSFSVPTPLRASHRDGFKRFDHLREKQALTKAEAEQKARGNLKEADRISKEKNKVDKK